MSRMLVLMMIFGAILGASLVAAPEAGACQPYTIDCPFSSKVYAGCGTQVPGPFVQCVLDAAPP